MVRAGLRSLLSNEPAVEVIAEFHDLPTTLQGVRELQPAILLLDLTMSGASALPAIPEDCQWANFVRNHDELTLDKLSDDERQEVFAAFGPEEELQLYGRGLRRRLPTMLGGDQRRIRMVYSLAFSLPGTPVLFYGEEIGMAENLGIDGRYSVRAPMQWTDEPNGGFTTADEPVRPIVEGGQFGYRKVNAASQRRCCDSESKS